MNWYNELELEDLKDEPDFYLLAETIGIEKTRLLLEKMESLQVRFKQLKRNERFINRMIDKYGYQVVRRSNLVTRDWFRKKYKKCLQ